MVGRRGVSLAEQRDRPGAVAGQPGGVCGVVQELAATVVRRRKLGRPLEGCCRDDVGASGTCACTCLLERWRCDVVEAGRGRREMPRTTVDVTIRQRVGKSSMGRTTLGGSGVTVDCRARERMTELEGRALRSEQDRCVRPRRAPRRSGRRRPRREAARRARRRRSQPQGLAAGVCRRGALMTGA